MSYATQTALEAAFGADEILQLTDRERSGAVDAAFLAQTMTRADALVDSYLSGRYVVPIPGIAPPIIVAIAGDLARYFLYDDAAPDRVRQAYEDALAWLKGVARGDVALTGVATLQALSGGVRFVSEDRRFPRGEDF